MLGGVSSSRSYQSLSSSPRKNFWMIGTTLGMKISLTSPSNSTHGSKIREKLSKKRDAVWQWQPREGKLSTKAWRLRTLRTALWHSWPRTKNVVPSKNYSRTTPSFQQVYLTSWWGSCSHNCCFLRQTWLLTLTGVALEKWNSHENMGVNLVIAEVTNGEKKRLWLKPIRGPCFLGCHEEIWSRCHVADIRNGRSASCFGCCFFPIFPRITQLCEVLQDCLGGGLGFPWARMSLLMGSCDRIAVLLYDGSKHFPK